MDTKQAERHNQGKPKYSLIPLETLEPIVRVLEFGAEKYSRDNWKKGLPVTEILDSLLRHVASIQGGELIDKESGLPHAGHIGCNVLFLLHILQNRPEYIDIKLVPTDPCNSQD